MVLLLPGIFLRRRSQQRRAEKNDDQREKRNHTINYSDWMLLTAPSGKKSSHPVLIVAIGSLNGSALSSHCGLVFDRITELVLFRLKNK